jgi:lipoprotein
MIMKKLLTALFILGGLLLACGKEGNQITQAEGVKKIEADGAMVFDFHHEQGEARTADIWIETYESGQTVDEPIASMLTFAEAAEVQSMQVLMDYGKHGLRKNEITLVTPTEEVETVDELDSLEGVTFKGQHSIYLSYENLAPNKEVIIGVMTFEASEQSTVKEQIDALLTDDLDPTTLDVDQLGLADIPLAYVIKAQFK